MRVVVISLAVLGVASAAQLSLGFKGGGRVSGDLDSFVAHSESRRYVIGPTAELDFRTRWTAVVEALYRRNGYGSTSSDILGAYFTRARANSWEFPVLLKRRLNHGLFIDGGYAVRMMRWTEISHGIQITPAGPPNVFASVYHYPRQVSHGVVAGLGVEIGAGRLCFAPEFRYTHWNNRPLDIEGSRGSFIHSLQNQADILVGVRWR